MNALYDPLNNTYQDCVIQASPKTHEVEAARIMVKRLLKSSCRNLVMADRSYGSLDLMETIRDSNSDFLIRVQEKFIKETVEMPMEELDTFMTLTICTNQTKEINKLREKGKIKKLTGPSKFGKPQKNVTWFHPSLYVMKLRIVRLKLSTGAFETIATSLDPKKFPPDVIKELYHLRWKLKLHLEL